MELRNKASKQLLLKCIKKIKINKLVLKHVKVNLKLENTKFSNDECVRILENYSKKPTCDSEAVCKRIHWNNNKNYNINIIVPVYNGEQYIVKCLESLLSQKTNYSYSIILINDGSTDKTSELLKKYTSDERVILIEQENRGHSGARNKALELINAEYIAFVDADDFVSQDMVQTLVEKAEIYHADIVQGGFEKFMGNRLLRKKVIYNEEVVENPYTVSGFPWAKVFRSSLFERIRFPEGYWYEDSIMSHLVYPLAKKIVTVSQVVYYYRTNMRGISRTSVKYRKCIDSSWILEEMLNSRKLLCLVNDQHYLELFLDQIVINYRREINVSEDIRKNIFQYNINLYNIYFSKDVALEQLDIEKKNLLLSLLNNDYKSYKMICTFI